MLCLRSSHGDRGVPWWLINTQGAIHLYTGCVRGRAAGTSAPTTNANVRDAVQCQHSSGLTDLNLPSCFALALWWFSLGWSVFGNFLFVSFLPNALIALTDSEITCYCVAEMNSHTHIYSSSCCGMMSVKYLSFIQLRQDGRVCPPSSSGGSVFMWKKEEAFLWPGSPGRSQGLQSFSSRTGTWFSRIWKVNLKPLLYEGDSQEV